MVSSLKNVTCNPPAKLTVPRLRTTQSMSSDLLYFQYSFERWQPKRTVFLTSVVGSHTVFQFGNSKGKTSHTFSTGTKRGSSCCACRSYFFSANSVEFWFFGELSCRVWEKTERPPGATLSPQSMKLPITSVRILRKNSKEELSRHRHDWSFPLTKFVFKTVSPRVLISFRANICPLVWHQRRTSLWFSSSCVLVLQRACQLETNVFLEVRSVFFVNSKTLGNLPGQNHGGCAVQTWRYCNSQRTENTTSVSIFQVGYSNKNSWYMFVEASFRATPPFFILLRAEVLWSHQSRGERKVILCRAPGVLWGITTMFCHLEQCFLFITDRSPHCGAFIPCADAWSPFLNQRSVETASLGHILALAELGTQIVRSSELWKGTDTETTTSSRRARTVFRLIW